MSRRWLQVLLLFVVAFTMLGADDASTTRMDRIGHKMVCQCGCGQILMECNHVGCPVSGPMIDELRTELAAGTSEAAILQNFIAKYGPVVLAAPIRGGFDYVAWVVPIVGFFLGTVGVGLLIVFWRRRFTRLHPASAMAAEPEPSDDLRERIRRDTDYSD